jgi:hypothetical protein
VKHRRESRAPDTIETVCWVVALVYCEGGKVWSLPPPASTLLMCLLQQQCPKAKA